MISNPENSKSGKSMAEALAFTDGVRSGEVGRMQLTNIDWQRETITITRSKIAINIWPRAVPYHPIAIFVVINSGTLTTR